MSDMGTAMTDTGKTIIGLSGIFAWFTLSEWSLIAGIIAAAATAAWMMLQVAHRLRDIYREYKKKRDGSESGE